MNDRDFGFTESDLKKAMAAVGFTTDEINYVVGGGNPAKESGPQVVRNERGDIVQTRYSDGKVVMGRDLGIGEIVPDEFKAHGPGHIIIGKPNVKRLRGR